MIRAFERFERVARNARSLGTKVIDEESVQVHPFDERNIHPDIATVSQALFDNGHYSQATFEAFKLLDLEVGRLSGVKESGFKLMMEAFNEKAPKIQLTDLKSVSATDEQLGYRFIFAGAMSAIRNPRGHDITLDPIHRCLDHLSMASVLLRRIEDRLTPRPKS